VTGGEQTAENAGLHVNVTRRFIALDIGDVRTGVAMSDSTNTLASPAAVLIARNKESLLDEFESFIEMYSASVAKELALMVASNDKSSNGSQAENEPPEDSNDDASFTKRIGDFDKLTAAQLFERVVIGLPLDQSGNETVRAAKVREWGEYVASGVELRAAFVDERYTTRRMIEADKASKRRAKDGKANIDARSAAEILQSFIDAKRFTDSLMSAEKAKFDGTDAK
jgi:putative holliday junction resolvase